MLIHDRHAGAGADGQKRVSTQIIADYVQRPEEPAYYESADAAGAYAENMA